MSLTKRKNHRNNLFPSLADNFFGNRFLSPSLFDSDSGFWNREMQVPLANVTETKDSFNIELSVPGLKRDDFNVEVENGMLTISCEKEEERNENDENFTRREFSYNSFERTFQLPENVVEDKINAKYDNGMLKVSLPKKEVSTNKSKKAIKVG
jgi:HSP20 family protein